MKSAFHVDREGLLKSGMIIKPVNKENVYNLQGLSSWGLKVINPGFSSDVINTLNVEAVAEDVRKESFPDMPSRLQVFFAFENLDEIALWAPVIGIDESMPIYKVHYEGNSYNLDAKLLNQIAVFNAETIRDNPEQALSEVNKTREELKKYWSGQFTDNPLPELIIELPVIIGERVR